MSISACPLCSSTRLVPGFKDLVLCQSCGLQFLKPDQFPKDPCLLYGEKYFHGAVYSDYLQEEKIRLEWFRAKMELIKGFLPRAGKVLDVGCAMGFYLKVMQESGYSVYGVDISTYAARLAASVPGVTIHTGDLCSAAYPPGYFDLVAMWDLLEHLPDPRRDLLESNRILKEDGVLVMETVNIGSLCARLLREKWPLYFPPYHLYHFSKPSVLRLLERSGFVCLQVIPIQTYLRTPWGTTILRYFKSRFLRKTVGMFFDDVLVYVAQKTKETIAQ